MTPSTSINFNSKLQKCQLFFNKNLINSLKTYNQFLPQTKHSILNSIVSNKTNQLNNLKKYLILTFFLKKTKKNINTFNNTHEVFFNQYNFLFLSNSKKKGVFKVGNLIQTSFDRNLAMFGDEKKLHR
jgi:hypothetical protein